MFLTLFLTLRHHNAKVINMELAARRLQNFTRAFTSTSIARRAMSSPTESEKPIVLYSAGTPNGLKVSTFLEELRGHYGGPDYEYAPFCDPQDCGYGHRY